MDFPNDSELSGMRSTVIGRGPISDIAVDVSDATVVVANYGDNSASVIDEADQAIRATLPISGEPVLASVANHRAYVASSSASHDSVSVIDTATGTVVATHAVESGLTALAADPGAQRAFVGRSGRDRAQIAVIDAILGDRGVIDIAVGSGLLVEALHTGKPGVVYAAVSDATSGCLYAVDIDGARVKAGMVVDAPIRDIAVGSDNRAVYVLTCNPQWGGRVTIFDSAGERHGSVAIEGWPTQLAIGPDDRLYVLNGNNIDVIETDSLRPLSGIETDTPLSSVTVDRDGVLHIADYSGVVTSIPVSVPAQVELLASA
jgi:DNA-binding beta-propeller fold protein YncE